MKSIFAAAAVAAMLAGIPIANAENSSGFHRIAYTGVAKQEPRMSRRLAEPKLAQCFTGSICRNGPAYCVGIGFGCIGFSCCGCGFCGVWSSW